MRTVLEPPKRGGPHFTSLLAKGMKGAVDAGVPIKIELGVGADGAGAAVTHFEDWKRGRAR